MLNGSIVVQDENLERSLELKFLWRRVFDSHNCLVVNDIKQACQYAWDMTSLANSDVQVTLLNHKAQIVAHICLALLIQYQHVLVSLLLSIKPELSINIDGDALRYSI